MATKQPSQNKKPPRRRQPRQPGGGAQVALNRLFALVCSPWLAALGFALLAAVHFAQAYEFRVATPIPWNPASPTGIALVLLAVHGLAVVVVRFVPVFTVQTRGSAEQVQPDVVTPVANLADLGLKRDGDASHRGVLSLVGATLAFLAVFVISGWTVLFPAQGLDKGGELVLRVGQGGEAAFVRVDGIQVKQNLDGLRYEIVDVTPARLAGDESTQPSVTLRATNIQSREVSEATLVPGVPVRLSGHVLLLSGIEPAFQTAGLLTRVTERDSGRTFTLNLRRGLTVEDPFGPGTFQLQTLDQDILEGLGGRARGVVTIKGETKNFTVFEKDPDYDKTHRQGRYALSWVEPIPGRRVRLRLARPTSDLTIPIAVALMALGFTLLFAAPHRSIVLFPVGGELHAGISSVNDGGAVLAALADDEPGGGA